jgi:hypothetical protein
VNATSSASAQTEQDWLNTLFTDQLIEPYEFISTQQQALYQQLAKFVVSLQPSADWSSAIYDETETGTPNSTNNASSISSVDSNYTMYLMNPSTVSLSSFSVIDYRRQVCEYFQDIGLSNTSYWWVD